MRRRALLKKIKRRVLVGDGVELTEVDRRSRRRHRRSLGGAGRARTRPWLATWRSWCSRSSARRSTAKQLTRFLVSMEHAGVPFRLVLNKSDLASDDAKADWAARLNQWGYDPMFVSVATGEGIGRARGAHSEARPRRGGGGGGMMMMVMMMVILSVVVVMAKKKKKKKMMMMMKKATGASARHRPRGAERGGEEQPDQPPPRGIEAAEALRDEMREMAETAEENEEEEEDDEDVGTSDSGASDSDSGASDSGASDSDSSSDSSSASSPSSRVYVTDVDTSSGGGGGARGAVRVEGLSLQSVKSVSAKLGRGRHTTRHVTLPPLASGGLLADTPGFGYPSSTR